MWKPMLAGKLDPPFTIPKNRFPLMLSPKLDGVRASIQNAAVMSRALKPIPNRVVQASLGKPELEGLDGELISGSIVADDAFRKTTSAVMTMLGTPKVTYHVFDCFQEGWPFMMRYELAGEMIKKYMTSAGDVAIPVVLVPHVVVKDAEEMLAYEEKWVAEGYEGAMIRSLQGPYKQGRSTWNEGYLIKLKRFVDGEAVVVGFEECLHNANAAKINELGYTSHSSHKENLVPLNTLGALIVKDCVTGIEFNIGTGFKEAERNAIWQQRDVYVGKVVKYKYQPVGVKEKPRIPSFQGWRDPLDMDEL